MADQFVGEIRAFGFNFAPVGWALCDGQLLPISQYTAVFALLGTFYGGNGTSNFALPNLQGNVPMSFGSGAGLTVRDIGESGGESSVTLLQTEIPAHNHALEGTTAFASKVSPVGNLPAVTVRPVYGPDPIGSPVHLNAQAVGSTGGSLAHNNLQLTLVVNFCIALQGIFPARQ